MHTAPMPRFSVVTAVHNVERYLPDFIASMERQSFDLDQVEIVMVDDGSTDGSLRILEEWEERRPGTVRVISQDNAGQGAARNTGMAKARGEWVTFPDPDEINAASARDQAAAARRRRMPITPAAPAASSPSVPGSGTKPSPVSPANMPGPITACVSAAGGEVRSL